MGTGMCAREGVTEETSVYRKQRENILSRHLFSPPTLLLSLFGVHGRVLPALLYIIHSEQK